MFGTELFEIVSTLINGSGECEDGRFPSGKCSHPWRQPNNFREISFVDKAAQYGRFAFPYQYDRTWRNDDGTLYYGIDNGDGSTDWYNEDGGAEGRTDTPSEDEQDENNYRNDGYGARCPHCNGTGYDALDGGQCEYCNGSGENPQ